MGARTNLTALFHCVYNLNYHLVLVTEYRRRCINAEMLERLRGYCRALAVKWGCEVLEFNGEADHVRLLLALTPRVAPSAFVNNLKTVTSRYMRRDFPEHLRRYYRRPVFWSRSYCIVSCGGAPLSVIKQYIEQQAAPA